MIALAKDRKSRQSVRSIQRRFLELLPNIERYARWAFRGMNVERREEALQDVRAHAWRAYRRLADLDREEVAYAGALARFAVAQFRDGRRVGTPINSRDVCSPQRKRSTGIRVYHFGIPGRHAQVWEEGLVDNTTSPIPDQVAFRIDFPRWLATHSPRDRRIAEELMVGNRPLDVARSFGISPGRVSQIRRALAASWSQFDDEPPVTA
jgi:hypothetical protein